MLTRRAFTKKTIGLSALLALASHRFSLAEAGPEQPLRMAGGGAIEIPPNFIGLGYEMLSVATPKLLNAANHRYVELIRGLAPGGVLRVGGIVADYTRYMSEGSAANDCKDTVITRAALHEFAAFLSAIGWKAIWSVNFAQGTVEQAVEEARAVSEALGPQLLALEIGNEVENYGKGQPFRATPYTYETYRKEFDAWHAAIARAVPRISFAGPDTAQSMDWVERMASDPRGEVQLLTTHYYRNRQSRGTAEQLLTPDPRLEDILVRMRIASRRSGIPWRICEINSFSGGGRPGVSDTFIGALWTLNTMLLLAQSGCSGVNVETGVNQLGFVSSYSPIQDDGRGMNSAGVPYYGMLAFATAFSGNHQLLSLESSILDEGVSTYVFGAADKPRSVVIVNMTTRDAHISLASLGVERASVLRLIAPALDSRTGVTFGGTTVDPSGHWKPDSEEKMRQGRVFVPRMSAAVLRLDERRRG